MAYCFRMVTKRSNCTEAQYGENIALSGDVRLSRQVVEQIGKTIRSVFSEGAEVLLFGSRVQPSARGGDLDLLVIADATRDVLARARIRAIALLQIALGEQHIDLVVISEIRDLNIPAVQSIKWLPTVWFFPFRG